jgi:rhodanese-related sulfurtransferase
MNQFEDYIKNFDYQSIPKIKITGDELLQKIVDKEKIQIVDIRFKEEAEVWKFPFFKQIPINELPERLNELDKDSLIVTVCPHNVRSNIAMHYLMLKGYNVKFLTDGLTNIIHKLLGGSAKKIYSSVITD